MAEIISGIYKIINTITGDFYIGSSKDIKRRWKKHKYYIKYKEHPNNQMYLDMQKYGVEKFDFQILEKVEIAHLKEKEQWFIEILKPTYNNRRANGLDVERRKEYNKEHYQQNRKKHIEYYQQNRKKHIDYQNKYNNQLCYYNGETLTLCALSMRFRKSGIEHPTIEAKKYLVYSYANKKA